MSGGGHSNRHGLLRLKDKNSKSSCSSVGEEMTQATMDELEQAVRVLSDRYESTRKELTSLQVGVSLFITSHLNTFFLLLFQSMNSFSHVGQYSYH